MWMRWLMIIVLVLPAVADVTILGPFAARDGERCVVCNTRVTNEDSAFLVDGKRVAVMKGMEAQFLADPVRYVTSLHPGGPVDVTRPEQSAPRGYLWVGVFLMMELMFGAACAHLASVKGLSSWRWFLAGFLFSAPAVMVLAMRPMPEAAPEGTPKILR